MNNNQSWQTVAVVGLGVSVAPLDTAVNIAFPAITQAFGLSVPVIQWIVICYILTYASLLLNCGRWADMIGHRQVFLLGVITSSLALSLCALAPSYQWLLLARVGQALGAAMILAAGPALVTLAFTSEKRSKAVAGYGFAYAVASALGPLLGGIIIERWGWSAVFWARIPLAVSAAVLVVIFLKNTTPTSTKTSERFDLRGAIWLTITIICLLLAINRLGATGLSTLTVTTLIIGAIALLLFIRQEWASTTPLIDLSWFRYPAFVGVNLAHALGQMAGFVVLLLCPYYLVLAFQNNVVQAGMMLSLAPCGMVLASALAAWLSTYLNAYQLGQLGAGLLSVGLAAIGYWSSEPNLWLIPTALIIHGLGLGLFQVANMDLVMATLPRDAQGVAGSLVMLTRTIGVVSGASLSFVLFAALHGAEVIGIRLDEAFISAFRITFLERGWRCGSCWVVVVMVESCGAIDLQSYHKIIELNLSDLVIGESIYAHH